MKRPAKRKAKVARKRKPAKVGYAVADDGCWTLPPKKRRRK